MPNGDSAAAWHRRGKDGDHVSGTYFLHGSCFLRDNSGAGKRERWHGLLGEQEKSGFS